jgi:hypothetical protein
MKLKLDNIFFDILDIRTCVFEKGYTYLYFEKLEKKYFYDPDASIFISIVDILKENGRLIELNVRGDPKDSF